MKVKTKPRVFGVIGYPIKHTLSPAMQNAAFKKLGIDASYLPFEVSPKDLGKAVRGIRELGFSGVNVTIPHKEAVIKYIDRLSVEAKLIGAVNTIVNKGGKLAGYNTDYFGFLKAVREDLKFNPSNKTACIIGAGGAAKAVAFGIAQSGAKRIIITDTVDEKSLELACEVELKTGCQCIAINPKSPGLKELILNSQLLVNATPCGMRGNDPIVVNPGFMHQGLCIFDLVYNKETKLIKTARRLKIKAAGGLNMLLYQGARSFELWTGKRAPVEAMRKALTRKV